MGLEEHPAQRGVNRQAGQVAPQRRQLAGLVEGAQLLEQGVTALDGGPVPAG